MGSEVSVPDSDRAELRGPLVEAAALGVPGVDARAAAAQYWPDHPAGGGGGCAPGAGAGGAAGIGGGVTFSKPYHSGCSSRDLCLLDARCPSDAKAEQRR
eukprot:9954099-Alexandrium_andersonii.AAC.1